MENNILKLDAALFEEYKAEVVRNERTTNMINFELNRCSYLMRFRDGLIHFIKENIETHFCFGYGWNGVSDNESEENASNMAKYARTQEEYFIEQNLESYDRMIYIINNQIDELLNKKNVDYKNRFYELSRCKIYLYKHYCYKNVYEVCARHVRDILDMSEDEKFRLITPTLEELQEILKVYESERAKKQKRLNTYLKKYGLSKLYIWTYLRD